MRKAHPIHSPPLQVQAAAAELFTAVNKAVGARILEEILPDLLNDVIAGSAAARVGLQQLLKSRGAVILSYMLPRILDNDVLSLSKLQTLSAIAESSRGSIVQYLEEILPILVATVAQNVSTPDVLDCARRFVLSLNTSGVTELINYAFVVLGQNKVCCLSVLTFFFFSFSRLGFVSQCCCFA